MAGIDYEKHRMQQVMEGTIPMSKDTWYSHAERVYQAIIEVAEQKEEEDLQRLRTAGTASGYADVGDRLDRVIAVTVTE